MPIRDLLVATDRRRTGGPVGEETATEAQQFAAAHSDLGTYFGNIVYSGKNAGYSLNTGFAPNLVILRDLTTSADRFVYDSVRGATQQWRTNSSALQATTAQGLTAFYANGFTLGTDIGHNVAPGPFLASAWVESVDAGLDIISYTGTGAGRTIAHNLNALPNFGIIKRLSGSTVSATVYSSLLSVPQTDYLVINTTALPVTDANFWNNVAATSTTFSLGSATAVNASGSNYVAYLWTAKAGVSAFGTYTGNGSASGPTVNLGWNPRTILIKRISVGTGEWRWYPRIREGAYTTMSTSEASEVAAGTLTFQSTGFQITSTSTAVNASGSSYLYAAWA